jgi:hypothetical protein
MTMVQDLMTVDESTAFYSGVWGDVSERVTRGVAFLDREVPDWRSRIVINDLDLSSTCSCVVGQVFGEDAAQEEGYEDGFDLYYHTYVKRDDPVDAPAFYGFDCQWDEDGSVAIVSYTALQEEWTRVLQA